MKQITVDLDLLKLILSQEARKLTGKVCKRFEISSDQEQIKREVKELIYEHERDLMDFFSNGQMLFTNQKEQ